MPQDLKTILFNYTKTARREIREFGDHSAIGQAAANNWWVYEKLLTAAGLMEEYEAWEKGESFNKEDWGNQPKTVTMTNHQWNRLTVYLLMSTQYRMGEQESWEKLAQENNRDGSPVFQHAASNADFWKEMNDDLENIKAEIDS